jgi:hypothetical protein
MFLFQIFHLLVVAAAFVHYHGVIEKIEKPANPSIPTANGDQCIVPSFNEV